MIFQSLLSLYERLEVSGEVVTPFKFVLDMSQAGLAHQIPADRKAIESKELVNTTNILGNHLTNQLVQPIDKELKSQAQDKPNRKKRNAKKTS